MPGMRPAAKRELVDACRQARRKGELWCIKGCAGGVTHGWKCRPRNGIAHPSSEAGIGLWRQSLRRGCKLVPLAESSRVGRQGVTSHRPRIVRSRQKKELCSGAEEKGVWKPYEGAASTGGQTRAVTIPPEPKGKETKGRKKPAMNYVKDPNPAGGLSDRLVTGAGLPESLVVCYGAS